VRCYPATTRINLVVNDDAARSAPVEVAETQVRLFSESPRKSHTSQMLACWCLMPVTAAHAQFLR